jgi:hypothetical protein
MPMAGSNINIPPIDTPDAVLDCPDLILDRTANRRGRPMIIERAVGGELIYPAQRKYIYIYIYIFFVILMHCSPVGGVIMVMIGLLLA